MVESTLISAKELDQIKELEKDILRKRKELNERLDKKKRLLGGFLLDMLENDKPAGIRQYASENLEVFFNKADQRVIRDIIDNLKTIDDKSGEVNEDEKADEVDDETKIDMADSVKQSSATMKEVKTVHKTSHEVDDNDMFASH